MGKNIKIVNLKGDFIYKVQRNFFLIQLKEMF